jgi:hypothetical protein
MIRRWLGIPIAIAVVVVAATLLVVEKHRPNAHRTAASRLPITHSQKRPSSHLPTATAPSPIRMPHPLEVKVADKYAALLETLTPDMRAQLSDLLANREVVDQTNLSEAAHWERQISLLLREDDYALYEQLRESQLEQARLQAFADQLLPISPLTSRQQHELLLAKLQHTRQVQALELQLDAPRADLSAMESGYARDIAAQGIGHHNRTFLEDVRWVLTEQQRLALERIETDELAKRLRESD